MMMGKERAHFDYLVRGKLLLLGFFIFLAFAPTAPGEIFQAESDNCVKCHLQATGRAFEVVGVHRTSAHARAEISCGGCHGGDPEQVDKQKAHSGKFTGKPERAELLSICGNCHERQLDQFRSSRHFPDTSGRPRLDCVDCHGAHSIGNPPESFSLANYCASCHGLEYLPPLARPLQDLVSLIDELNDKTRRLSAKGSSLSNDFLERRREIRGLTAEIIHLTGNSSEIGKILRAGEKLR